MSLVHSLPLLFDGIVSGEVGEMDSHIRATVQPVPRVGTMLPSFQLPTAGGGSLGPWAFKGRRNLVLYFVDSVDCLTCQRALRDLADRYRELRDHEAEVLVIAPLQQDRALRARSSLGLPFPILVDPDSSVYARYGLLIGNGHAVPAVLVADRYGEIFAQSIGTPDHALIGVAEILSWLQLIEIQCPE